MARPGTTAAFDEAVERSSSKEFIERVTAKYGDQAHPMILDTRGQCFFPRVSRDVSPARARVVAWVDTRLGAVGLRLYAFPRCRRPLDGGDDLVAPNGVGEVRHGVSIVLDV